MKRILKMAVPLVAVVASGCLATKGDIRLLQDEMQATRSQVRLVDTSVLRSSQQLRQQIVVLSTELLRLSDSVRIQSARLASLQANANGELNAMNTQIVQMQALLGQTTRNMQETRERIAALSEQTSAPPPPSPSGAPSMPGDNSRRAPSGLPGSATLYLLAKQQLDNGAYGTARTAFDQLLNAYPNSVEAPAAQFYVAQSHTLEGNLGAADSVYVVLYTKYPKSPYASTSLYRHGTYLWDQGKKAEARIALNRVLAEYPNSDEVQMVKSFLRDRDK